MFYPVFLSRYRGIKLLRRAFQLIYYDQIVPIVYFAQFLYSVKDVFAAFNIKNTYL